MTNLNETLKNTKNKIKNTIDITKTAYTSSLDISSSIVNNFALNKWTIITYRLSGLPIAVYWLYNYRNVFDGTLIIPLWVSIILWVHILYGEMYYDIAFEIRQKMNKYKQ